MNYIEDKMSVYDFSSKNKNVLDKYKKMKKRRLESGKSLNSKESKTIRSDS